MTVHHCRIGKVRFRGGPELTILPERSEMPHRMMESVRNLLDNGLEVHGFAIVAWGPDYDYMCDYQIEPESSVSSAIMPIFVHDALLRHVIKVDVSE